MEGLVNKILNRLDIMEDSIIVKNISNLKTSRFYNSFSISGKGVVKSISLADTTRKTGILYLIVDDKDTMIMPIDYLIYLDSDHSYWHGSLNVPIEFNKSFVIKSFVKNDSYITNGNIEGNIVYTVERGE